MSHFSIFGTFAALLLLSSDEVEDVEVSPSEEDVGAHLFLLFFSFFFFLSDKMEVSVSVSEILSVRVRLIVI